jgi:outer membrane protein OmpA-like peptidoglycan-associated protein
LSGARLKAFARNNIARADFAVETSIFRRFQMDDTIRTGMQVLGSDGGMVGRVIGLHDDHIHVEPTAPAPGATEHVVPTTWVARVDDHVHLDRAAALVRDTWGTGEPGAATAVPAGARAEDRDGRSWMVWLLGAILLLAVIFLGIRGCDYSARDANYEDNAKGELSEAERRASGAAAADSNGAGALNNEVQVYLASADSAPKTFTFRNLNFDTGSAEIRTANRDELAQLGRTLAAHPDTRLRVVGYADARGSGAANATLGKQRAEAVAATLIVNGVSSGTIETASGGEADPAATNRTAQGQAENRRTELVILAR